MKVLVGSFNQEKALVGAFSVIVKTSKFAKVCFQLYLEQLGHHADAEALGVAAVDAALGGGGHLAVLAARLAALQPLLVDPLDRAPEEGAA